MKLSTRFTAIILVVTGGLVGIGSLNTYFLFRTTQLNQSARICDNALHALHRLQILTTDLLSTETLNEVFVEWKQSYQTLQQFVTRVYGSKEIHALVLAKADSRVMESQMQLWNSTTHKLDRIRDELSVYMGKDNPSRDGILLQYAEHPGKETYALRNDIYDAIQYLATDFETRFNEIVKLVHNETKRKVGWTLVLVAFFSAGLVLSILLILVPFLVKLKRHLGEIHQSMTQLGRGDFSTRIDIPGKDELGDISRAINLTTDNLEIKQRELEAINENLEDKVSERTSELKQAVTKLEHEVGIRKKTEQEIAKQRAEFEAIFNSISDAVIFADVDRRIVLVNPAFSRILGYQPENVTGKHTRCIYASADDDEKRGAKMLHKTAEIHQEIYQMEYKRQDDTVFTGETLSAHVCNRNDEVIGFVGIIRDITERIAAEKEKETLEIQLRQAQKMEALGTLAGGIAHDFNNILTSIIGYAELALDESIDDGDIDQFVEPVLKSGLRAKDLVQQILAFSRQSSQEHQPVKVQTILNEVLSLLRSSIPTTIEIKHTIDPKCPLVLADPTQIHQILMNLCTNAYHAMREGGGVLTLSLTSIDLDGQDGRYRQDLETGRYVKIEVCDTGIGMNQMTMDRIFDPYFTTKSMGEGTGLGLAAVHGIVSTLGGDIALTSEMGQGTTFVILLPAVEHMTKQHQESRGIPIPGGSESILFVDDDEQVAKMNARMLARLGYKVDAFTNSMEAMRRILENPNTFDLLITDMTMPHMTGAMLAQKTLAIRPDTPIILCTGFSDAINEEKAKTMGIRRLLMKPIVQKEFANTIRQVLDVDK